MATIVLIPGGHWPPPIASPRTCAWKTVRQVPPHYCHLCRKWQTWATVKPILIFVFIRKNGDSQPRSKHGIIGTIKNFLKIIGVEVKVCRRLIFNISSIFANLFLRVNIFVVFNLFLLDKRILNNLLNQQQKFYIPGTLL